MQDEGLGPGAGHLDEIILPHLDAAYNLAHWLVRNRVGAGDVVYDWMQSGMRLCAVSDVSRTI